MMLAQRERIIAAHTYFVVAHDVYSEVEGFRVMYQGIYPEFPYVVAGVLCIVYGTEVGAHVEAMLYAAYGERETAAAMSECHTQLRVLFKHAAEYHGADSAAGFCRHTYQPWQPVAGHVILAHHLPRVYENAAAQLFRCFPEWRK